MDFSLGELLFGIGGLLAGIGALVVLLRLAELIDRWKEKLKSEEEDE